MNIVFTGHTTLKGNNKGYEEILIKALPERILCVFL